MPCQELVHAGMLGAHLPWDLCVLSPLGDPWPKDTARVLYPLHELVCWDTDSDGNLSQG